MPATAQASTNNNEFICCELKPARYVPTLEDDVKAGLLSQPRSLPPKYFYDELGSVLFDRICDTEEYYPTRVESALLESSARELISVSKPDCIIELGSGTSRKTRFLFDACNKEGLAPDYWPMDVCQPMLEEAAQGLMQDYPWLNIRAFVGDYHGGLEHFPHKVGRNLYVFLGGTIGNFEHDEAVALLTEIRCLMKPGDYILLGFDRVKDTNVLEAAYNDAEGVTAEFNLNVLRVLNAGLQADFEPKHFEHQAIYNGQKDQIEMHLISKAEQVVQLQALDHTLHIEPEESIRTEISRKFTEESIKALLGESGLSLVNHQQAAGNYYSLVLAQC